MLYYITTLTKGGTIVSLLQVKYRSKGERSIYYYNQEEKCFLTEYMEKINDNRLHHKLVYRMMFETEHCVNRVKIFNLTEEQEAKLRSRYGEEEKPKKAIRTPKSDSPTVSNKWKLNIDFTNH